MTLIRTKVGARRSTDLFPPRSLEGGAGGGCGRAAYFTEERRTLTDIPNVVGETRQAAEEVPTLTETL